MNSRNLKIDFSITSPMDASEFCGEVSAFELVGPLELSEELINALMDSGHGQFGDDIIQDAEKKAATNRSVFGGNY